MEKWRVEALRWELFPRKRFSVTTLAKKEQIKNEKKKKKKKRRRGV